MRSSPGLLSLRVGVWYCAACHHADRPALLLAHSQRISPAAMGLALYPVEAGDLLWEGSRGYGPGKIYEPYVAGARPDVAISGMGGGAAPATKLVVPRRAKKLRPGHHSGQNFALGRKNSQYQMVGQRNVVVVAYLHDQKSPAIVFTQIQRDAF